MLLRASFLVSLVACGGKDEVETPIGDDDDAPSGCEEDLDCADYIEICDAGECVEGDRDNVFEEATPIFIGEEQMVSGVIYPEEDVDYFAYESLGDEWVSVRTISTGSAGLDTVVTVYTPGGAVHATLDDYAAYPFGVSGTLANGESVDFDTVLYVYFPSPGTWYIGVEDRVLLPDDPAEADIDYSYDLFVREAFGVGETDAIDDPGSTVELPQDGGSITAVGVVLESPGDSDWIEVTNPLDSELEVWGATGLDGSDATPLVRIYDAGTVVAEKEGLGAEWLSWFEGHAGTFVIQATDADGGGGSDHWFPLFVRTYGPGDSQAFFGENVYEPEVEPNDSEIQALDLGDVGDGYGAFRLQGRIDQPADIDWWSATATAGDPIDVRCFTEAFGSLALLEIGLYQGGVPFGALVTEPDADGFYLIDEPAPGSGSFEVRIRGEGVEFGPAAWYRCSIYVGG